MKKVLAKMPFLDKTHNSIFRSVFGSAFLMTFFVLSITLAIFVIHPHTADAQFVPVLDSTNLVQNTITATNSTLDNKKEYIYDGILSATTKIIISNITGSIVTWINSGFQGNPAFISNPEGYFTDVADQIAGNFIGGTELGFMCEPFSLDIRAALALNYSTTFTQRNYCRLSDVIKNTENFTKFTDGDFSRGGWNSWFQISQNPSNNPYGAQYAAQTEIAIRTARGQSIELYKANWGDGFLSYRECVVESSEPGHEGECLKYGDIQTPGSIINSQLSTALGTGYRQLELADEINEIVGVLVGQLIQTVFTEGLSSFGSGGKNHSTLQSSRVTAPLSASCSASNTVIRLGEHVTWTAFVRGGLAGAPTYQWNGDAPLAGARSASVDVLYTEPGRKSASVNVNKGGQNILQVCSNTVLVQ